MECWVRTPALNAHRSQPPLPAHPPCSSVLALQTPREIWYLLVLLQCWCLVNRSASSLLGSVWWLSDMLAGTGFSFSIHFSIYLSMCVIHICTYTLMYMQAAEEKRKAEEEAKRKVLREP